MVSIPFLTIVHFPGIPILHFQVVKGQLYLQSAIKEDSKTSFQGGVTHLALWNIIVKTLYWWQEEREKKRLRKEDGNRERGREEKRHEERGGKRTEGEKEKRPMRFTNLKWYASWSQSYVLKWNFKIISKKTSFYSIRCIQFAYPHIQFITLYFVFILWFDLCLHMKIAANKV